jgi:hypothetical protein
MNFRKYRNCGGFMNLETLYHHDLKEKKETDFSFSIEERKWAAEAVADCYKRIENGTAKKLKARD